MFDFMTNLSSYDSTKNEIKVLQILKKGLVTKCGHPKKMQDVDSKGNRYCMNCNLDL